jgi:prevent-host-death family protein
MPTVGLRELKNRLSEYVRKVKSGETVLVTDRGEVVAQLSPPIEQPERPDLPPGLIAMAKRGEVTLGLPHKGVVYPKMPPVLNGITAAQLLDEDRGER